MLRERSRQLRCRHAVLCHGATADVRHALALPSRRCCVAHSPLTAAGERVAGFLTYATSALTVALLLIWATPPEWGTSNIFVYVGICSLMGSLSVVSCKVGALSLKLLHLL